MSLIMRFSPAEWCGSDCPNHTAKSAAPLRWLSIPGYLKGSRLLHKLEARASCNWTLWWFERL